MSQITLGSAASAAPANTGADTGSVWGRLWQIPLLLVGVGLFLYGLQAFQETRPVTPFATHVND
ncbi:MAG: hypothetical protein WCI73_14375, partial [Phycisphaerae bacterium]